MRRLPELTLLLLAVIWGGTFLATRTILREMGPFTLVAIRFGLGALTLAVLTRGRPGREELRAGIGVGLVVALAYSGQTFALKTVESSLSAFLTAAGVPLVAILQALLLRRTPARRIWVAAGVAAVGVALMGLRAGLTVRLGPGELLTLAAAAAGATQVVMVGRYASRFEPLRFTMVGLATVALLALPLALFEPTPSAGIGTWGLVLAMGIVATGLVLGAMTWAQRTVEPARAVLIYALEPVFAGILGAFVGESIGPLAVLGGTIVVLAALIGEGVIGWPGSVRRVPNDGVCPTST